MPTYQSAWLKKDLFGFGLFSPMLIGGGFWMIETRILGIVVMTRVGRAGPERPMTLGEQCGIGALGLALGIWDSRC